MSNDRAIQRLLAWPRAHLANLPTPLIPAGRLAAELGAADILVKMDAETGFGLGGNKVRKLEFELAPDRVRDKTCLITAGGPQSNHCRVTAAFAARSGLRCILVMQAPEPERPTGNALLHRLFGAEIRAVADREARAPGMAAAAADIKRQGGRPLIVPIGASTGLGCLGYAIAALELTEQLDDLGPRPHRTVVFVASSSCGTLAGLALGMSLLGRDDVELVGVSADLRSDELCDRTLQLATEGADLLEWAGPATSTVIVAVDSQVGDGYGIPTDASNEATDLFGRLEGLVLDPTYTAKAGAGMIDWIRERGTSSGERIVFLHTGGHPGLLA